MDGLRVGVHATMHAWVEPCQGDGTVHEGGNGCANMGWQHWCPDATASTAFCAGASSRAGMWGMCDGEEGAALAELQQSAGRYSGEPGTLDKGSESLFCDKKASHCDLMGSA